MKPLPTILLLAGLVIFTPVQAEKQLLDAVALVVEKDMIPQSKVEETLAQTQAQLQARGIRITNKQALMKQVIDSLILKSLILQQAKAEGITPTDEDVQSALGQVAAQNGLSLEQLQARLNAQSDTAFENLREQLRQQLTLEQLKTREVYKRLVVTDEAVEAALARQKLNAQQKSYQLRQVLLRAPLNASRQERETLMQKAQDLRNQIINQGMDFSQAAVEFSQGPKALQGGDLGWFAEDQLPTFFESFVPNLKPQEISPPIMSPAGVHLIQLEAVKLVSTAGQGLSAEQMRRQLLEKKASQETELWLARLRDEAYVKIFVPAYAVSQEPSTLVAN